VIASADGVTFDVSLDWTADQAVPGVRLTAVLPSGVQIVKPADGASLQVGEGADAANSYYFKVFDSVKAGAKLDLTFSYTASAAAATGGAASSGSTNRTLLIFLAIFLVVVAVVVAAVAVRIRMSAGASDDEDDEEDGFAHDEGETEAADSDAPSGKKRRGSKGGMIAGGMLVLFVLAGSAVGWQAMKPSVVGDTISQVFAGGDPCATVVIPVAAAEGADPAATGSALFAALKPVSGVKAATFNVRTLSIEVGYCESETSEAELRNALAATGFVAPVVPAAENGS
jgi:hypothetical protein